LFPFDDPEFSLFTCDLASKELQKKTINEYLEKREAAKQIRLQKQKADELVGSSVFTSRYPSLEKEDSTSSSDCYVSSLDNDHTKNRNNGDEPQKEDTFNIFETLNFSKGSRDSSQSTVFSSSERFTHKNDVSNSCIQRNEALALEEGHGNELEAIFF